MQIAELLKAIAALIWPIVIGGVVLALLPIVRRLLNDSSSFEIEIAGNRVGVQRATDETRKLIEDLQDRINTLEQGVTAPAAVDGGGWYPPVPMPPPGPPSTNDPYAPWPPYPGAPQPPVPVPGGGYGGVPGGYGPVPGGPYGSAPGDPYGSAPGGSYGGAPGGYGSVPESEDDRETGPDERAEPGAAADREPGVPASDEPPPARTEPPVTPGPVTQFPGTPVPGTPVPGTPVPGTWGPGTQGPAPVPPPLPSVPPPIPWGTPGPVAPPPISSGKLLWVDDEPDTIVYERARAVEAGYSVLQARSTAEALHLLATEGPVDLVVSDMGRVERGGNYNPRAGLELVQAMRGAGNQTRVILYSSPESMAPVEQTVRSIPGVLHTSSPSRLAAMLR
ncbi:hypothetical protein AB0J86_09580 [Micromonospora sp. NPDC049559]|uniref:hypothetical protein n=1 Tax=Micromonospora sp. NPDC049559 TaxID=3155923 RepID=UPI00343DEBB1